MPGIHARSKNAAAFFDLDKTLMAGSSGMQFAKVAARRGIVGRRQLARWGIDHLRYRLRGASDEQTAEVMKVARELITGVPSIEIDRMGPEVMAGILPRVYPQMLEEINAHADAGRPCFIVSAAGNGIVSTLAGVLGMQGGIGTRYEVDGDGGFTGRLDGPFVYGEGKVEAMEAFAAEHGIDLDASYAYSDSASDLPMMRAVGHPVAVNPDPAARRPRRSRGLAGDALRALGSAPGDRLRRPARRRDRPRRVQGEAQAAASTRQAPGSPPLRLSVPPRGPRITLARWRSSPAPSSATLSSAPSPGTR